MPGLSYSLLGPPLQAGAGGRWGATALITHRPAQQMTIGTDAWPTTMAATDRRVPLDNYG